MFDRFVKITNDIGHALIVSVLAGAFMFIVFEDDTTCCIVIPVVFGLVLIRRLVCG